MSSSEPARVRVYDNDALTNMLTRDPETMANEFGKNSVTKSTISDALRASARADRKRAEKEAEEQRQRRYERHKQEALKRQEDAARSVREKLVENSVKRERRFKELCSDIEEGRKLSAEINKHLSLHEMNARTKQKRMFDEWNQQVYGGIQDRINDQLDAMDVNEISRRRRTEFQKFLDTTNAKGAIFRDIIIESEYDPLEPNRNCIKVDTTQIRDPVKRVLDRHHEETSTLTGPSRRPAAHVREMLETTLWGSGKIEATPHGYFAKMMNDTGPTKATVDKSKKSKTYESKIPFDHYNVKKGSQVTNSEFPVGKRTMTATTSISLG